MITRKHFLLLVTLSSLFAGTTSAQFVFDAIDVDPHVGDVCYAVTVADVDGDQDLDIVAISGTAAVWYRNPDWKKHTMIDDAVPRDLVCIAPHDIDGDGQVDFAVGAGWPQNGGGIYWISRSSSLEQPWQIFDIGAQPWVHRMRFADVLGRGKLQLVVSPLNGTEGQGVRLLAFPIPDAPKENSWKPVVMDGSLNRMHNHLHLNADDVGADKTVTASQEGLSLIERSESGFMLTRIADGSKGADPAASGAGEVKMSALAKNTSLVATIEPMHGNQVVVYPFSGAITNVRQRIVLDDSFNQGHALGLADLNGDGVVEVVAGFRQPRGIEPKGPGVIIYKAQSADGDAWHAFPLDLENMACEDLVIADVNGDGLPDIVAGGRATHNVKLYMNRSSIEMKL